MSKHAASPLAEEPDSKRSKIYGGSLFKVELNRADCNLDFTVDKDGLLGSSLYEDGFAYCWSGARANLGVRRGRYCFGCKVIAIQPVVMEDTQKDQQNLCRVGVSRGDDNVGSLGESEHSFGYGGTGKFSTSGSFVDYGGKFSVGDTIVCAVDLLNKGKAKIAFAKNGTSLGVAKVFNAGPKGLGIVDSPEKKLKWEGALYPHVLLKNVEVKMLFSVNDGLKPMEGFKPWDAALHDGNGVDGPIIGDHGDCEMMMMVGLPASGKTTWAEKWAKEHPEKRYMLLGTNLALDQMKVPGMHRKHNYGERFDRLMDRATKIFNKLMERASSLPRNYIVDQTNVYRSARLRKLKPFRGFRKIAVVIFPDEETLKHRSVRRYREMGKEVPAEAVNEMLANYALPLTKDMPGSIEPFDEVWFPELKREVAEKILQNMKSSLPPKSASKASQGSVKERVPRENSFGSGQGNYSGSYQVDRRESSGSYSNPYLEGSLGPYGAAGQGLGGLGATAGQPIRDRTAYSSPLAGGYYDSRDPPSYRGTPQSLQHHPVRDTSPYVDDFALRQSQRFESLSYKDPYASHALSVDISPYPDPVYREPPHQDFPYQGGDPRTPYSAIANMQNSAYGRVSGGLVDRTSDLARAPTWQGNVSSPYENLPSARPGYMPPSMPGPHSGWGRGPY